jgi:hypothetical protein
MTPKSRSTVAAACRIFRSFCASMFRRGLRRRILSFAIIANLLILPLPAAYVRSALALASETVRNSVERLEDTVHLASRSLKNVFRKRRGPGHLAPRPARQRVCCTDLPSQVCRVPVGDGELFRAADRFIVKHRSWCKAGMGFL